MQPAWAWGLVPSVRWPGRCYVRPAWINHVCARLCTSLWIPSRLHLRRAAWGENIPKNENSYKKSHQWKCLETVLPVFTSLILCKQFIIYLSSALPPISFDVWNERECSHPCRLSTDSALLHSGQIPQTCFQLLVTCAFPALWPSYQLHGPDWFSPDETIYQQNLQESNVSLDWSPAGGSNYTRVILYNNRTMQFLWFITHTPLHLERKWSFDPYDIICLQPPRRWVHVRSVFTPSEKALKVNSPRIIRPQHPARRSDADLD